MTGDPLERLNTVIAWRCFISRWPQGPEPPGSVGGRAPTLRCGDDVQDPGLTGTLRAVG